ncbi:hypothetical protein HX052_07595 [Myroides marinus]|jgi:hypothetical protein|uniref:hypothetical protein n=1 Tax=Myroides marinus TaxID=703342 RepID=UPI002575D424|nr:hypothetical protein [Myroides marinus]MDM1368152.1 hypothetical protein [Myroides marinus]MDM1372168.1 hypothetical protein [Myroides marinus]MDM1375097.1 hypothetical protein [Myroides marinus]MDM1379158.1 hypothetical protein [Myroides marinus]MDM1383268.1 hypothetical protein [Myroides marinus]
MKIVDLLQNWDIVTLEEIYDFFEETEDIFIVKYDGERSINKYTILLSSSDSRFELIRRDCDNRKEGLLYVLKKYYSI